MLLYKALQVDDEYNRLQLLSEGIKQITSQMPHTTTIRNPQLLKFLLCAYPYQPQNVDMLIKAFFEYYQNEDFFWSFTQAVFTIGEYQESKIVHGKKQSIFDVYLRKQKEGKTGQNHFYHFAESVLIQMSNVKLYICQCLPLYFELAKKLQLDISRVYDLYRVYLHNANSKELMFHLIESFEQLKNKYFVGEPWIEHFQDEIDLYKQSLIPQKLANRLKTQNLQILYEQYRSQQAEQGSTPLSDDLSPSIDKEAIIKQQVDQYQKQLCTQKTVNLIDESVDLYLFLKFIINPQKYELIEEWNQKFADVIVDRDDKGLKIGGSQLSDLEIVRSFKALNSMIVCPKVELLKMKVQNFLPKLFRQIHKTLNKEERNVNLYHLASLLNKLLELCAKQSVYQIIKLDMLFSLTQFFYNEEIVNVVQEMLDIDVDKYKLGYFVQEQVWAYIINMEWFDYLFNFLYKQKVGTKQQNEEIKTQILGMLQSMNRNYRGSIKQDQLPNQSYFSKSMNSKENLKDIAQEDLLNGKDVDNIKCFMQDKLNFNAQVLEEMLRLQSCSPRPNLIVKRESKFSRQLIEIPIKKKQVSLPKISKSPNKSINSPLSRDSSKRLSNDLDMNLSIMSKLSSTSTKRLDNSDEALSSNKLSRSNVITKGNASLFKQQSNQIKEVELIDSIQLIYWIINSLYQHQKRYQNSKECNLAQKLTKLITYDHLIQLFETYIKKIGKSEYGIVCGSIVNLIFEVVLYFKLEQFYEGLNEYFFQYIEGLSHQLVSQSNMLKKSMLIQTYFYGFLLNQTIGLSYLESNIYKFITIKVFNTLQQQFISPNCNNLFLLQFSKFIRCLFFRAPAYLLQQILYNYGFLSTLYESQRINIQNRVDKIQSTSYYFSMQIMKTIQDLLIKRQLKVILDNLRPLDLWVNMCKASEHVKIQEIQKEQINELADIRKIDKRKQKFKKLPTGEQHQIEEAIFYTPDLTHRNLKNMKLRKNFDL